VIDPTTLSARRGAGRLCFSWYRIAITVPERIGAFDPTGSTAVFETAVDDYAEVWVDGELPRRVAQQGGSVIAGFNAPNQLVIGRHLSPGQRIQLAVFGANGPLSDPPANFIWMRSARLLFFRDEAETPYALAPAEVNVRVVRVDPDFDRIVPPNPKLWKLASGFRFTEGPTWIRDGGYLLFRDPNANRIYRYDPAGEGALSVFREKSGDDGPENAQPRPNGHAASPDDRVLMDRDGHSFVSGPEGIRVMAPDGRHLGTIVPPRHPAGFAWGGAEGKTLYLTARDSLYRMPLLVEGVRP
jgi:gluconolactonase